MLDLSAHCRYKDGVSIHSAPIYRSPVGLRQVGIRTSQDKQDDPVHDQDGPEDRDVEDREPTAHKANGDGASGRVPELKLGQAADERAELLVPLGREAG